MSIQPVAVPAAKNTAVFIHQPYSPSVSLGKTAQDTIQFGHKHAHGKACTDAACTAHHSEHASKTGRVPHVLRRIGNWLHEFANTLITDLQKILQALHNLLLGKPKAKQTHSTDNHQHSPDCKGHHHH